MYKKVTAVIVLCLIAVIGLLFITSDNHIGAEKPPLTFSEKRDSIERNHSPKENVYEHAHSSDKSHTHSEKDHINGSDELMNHEPKVHTHKISDIRRRLCETPTESCKIKGSLSIEKEIIDADLKLAKSKEISVLLSSTNFNEILQELAESKISSNFYKLEDQLNQQILYDYVNIRTDGIFCGDQICAASIRYSNQDDWREFNKEFFSKNENLGNLFIKHFSNESRVLFLPNSESKAVIR
ncbi:hypothetical protein [Pseudoalteromonas sp. CO325X]|uniref:hypothetical protein n=1 Tax=Pseudoalteromonas sp. CO325X TaxID=1777262 RepID=UPI0013EE9460|nr:hypothetical protein [Pseudoalteromonas sp. CO325X]